MQEQSAAQVRMNQNNPAVECQVLTMSNVAKAPAWVAAVADCTNQVDAVRFVGALARIATSVMQLVHSSSQDYESR